MNWHNPVCSFAGIAIRKCCSVDCRCTGRRSSNGSRACTRSHFTMRKNRRLHLARDPMGIKPLYYSAGRKPLCFFERSARCRCIWCRRQRSRRNGGWRIPGIWRGLRNTDDLTRRQDARAGLLGLGRNLVMSMGRLALAVATILGLSVADSNRCEWFVTR